MYRKSFYYIVDVDLTIALTARFVAGLRRQQFSLGRRVAFVCARGPSLNLLQCFIEITPGSCTVVLLNFYVTLFLFQMSRRIVVP